MGGLGALGYQHKAGNRSIAPRSMAGSARRCSKTIQPIDGAVHKLTGNTTTATELLAGLPVVYLTTVGRKSGQPRCTPLIAKSRSATTLPCSAPTSVASAHRWVFNLEAEPHVKLGYRTTEIDVRPVRHRR